ncbi:MAG: NUDIX hydrolase [Betaproteobacteria bacterium]|nr:NUDIX hydrolase [Betaproteobacteria bacterium]
MTHCNVCGTAVETKIPPGDTHSRAVCPACGHIQYQNPKPVVGSVPEWEDGRILLCRRAIDPRHGKWTLPAGFMENGETAAEGAAREALEQANARVQVGELYTFYSLPHISQLYVFFRARLVDLDFSPGEESLEVRLFAESEIPWDELAFASVTRTLEHYFADRKAGRFVARAGDIRPPER